MRAGIVVIAFGFFLLSACHQDEPTSVGEQLQEDVTTIDSYLTANNIDAIKDDSGIRYVVHSQGTGPLPIVANCIKVNYTGKLLSDGSQFDSNTNYEQPLSLLVLGWQVILPKLKVGSKATLYIPSGYAYGSSAQNGIPANSNLIFDIELLNAFVYKIDGNCSDVPRIPDDQQLAKDVATIDQYLADKKITANTHASGLRYTIESLGTGTKPTLSNCISATYTGKLLSDGTVFDSNTSGFTSPLIKLIQGWQIGLALLPTGTQATLYIPSSLGYGSAESNKIPANSNLIFQIELTEVRNYNATTGTCDLQ